MPLSASTAAQGQTTYFSINNGKIVDPQGKIYVPRGINAGLDNASAAIAQGNGNPLLSRFPGLNYVRFSINASNPGTAQAGYPSPDEFDAFVNAMTAAHVVVEIEDHSCCGGLLFATQINCVPFTGSALDVQNSWYSAMAAHFANNPYVWFGTLNEPNSADGTYQTSAIAAISTQQTSNYDTIRAAGNNTIINMEAGIGGGNNGTVGKYGGFIVSDYAAMHNIVWELHAYSSADQATAAAQLSGSLTDPDSGGSGGHGIAAAQSIPSADGLVPVIFGEYGSSDGNTGSQEAAGIVAAVTALQQQNSGIGSAAWHWGYGNDAWSLTSDGTGVGPLTVWGTEVAGLISAVAATANGTSPSPDKTVITSGAGQQILDAQAERWTIAGGVVLENGAAAGYSANVIALAYVGGKVYQENSANSWWAWNGSGWTAASNPLAPTASGTVIDGNPGQYIMDAQGDVWQIVGGAVLENGNPAGYSANVARLAYVSGSIWQENASNLWWQWSGSTWSPTDGTSTSPV